MTGVPWIDPYRVHPIGPRPALMLPDGTVIDCEDGDVTTEDAPGVRAYTFSQWADDLAADGIGELLQWNSTPIRWRRTRADEHWQPRRSDVVILGTDPPNDPADASAGLVLVAGWMRHYGAQLAGSASAASQSLLRANITERLWLGIGAPKIIPIGGRQEMGPGGPGIKVGPLTHWDIPAAYASTLGGMQYGGWWRPRPPDPDQLDRTASNGTPIFARAIVRVPRSLAFGPMARRPRRRQGQWEQILLPLAIDAKPTYPRGRSIRSTWTWAEIQAARDQGCGVTVLDAWAHVVANDHRPFRPWWERIREGRDLGGFAGDLVKVMGNALVGRFFGGGGDRSIRWSEQGHWERRHAPNAAGGSSDAPDLAEQVTGALRAELGRVLNAAGRRVICAHTDGGWFSDDDRAGFLSDGGTAPSLSHRDGLLAMRGIRKDSPRGDGRPSEGRTVAPLPDMQGHRYQWRAKEHADRIDILNPSRMAVHTAEGIDYRVAGPTPNPKRAFAESWASMFKVPYNPGDHVIDPRDAELWAGVDAR